MGKGFKVIDLKIDTVEVAGSSPVVPTIYLIESAAANGDQP